MRQKKYREMRDVVFVNYGCPNIINLVHNSGELGTDLCDGDHSDGVQYGHGEYCHVIKGLES